MTPEQQRALAIAAARKRQAEAQTPKQSPLEMGNLGRVNAALQGAGQAVTGGFLDELVDIPTAAIRAIGPTTFGEEYAKQRQLSGEILGGLQENYPISTIGGNIAGGILGAGAIGATQAGRAIGGMLGSGNTGARIAKGALSGGATGAVYGAGTAETGERKEGAALGGLLGAGLGGAVPAVSGLARELTPNIDDATKALASKAKSKFGIDLNVNQIVGTEPMQNLQRVSQAIPLSGTAKNRDMQLKQWNNAISKTFGQNIDEFTMDAWDDAFTAAGKPFNDILSGKTIKVNQSSIDDLTDILTDAAQNIEPQKVDIVKNNIDRILSAVKNGEITGDQLNSIRSTLTANAKKADPFARPYIADVLNKVVDISADGDPAIKKALNEARKNYKNLNVALAAWDSTTNSINPTALERAVKSPRAYGLRSYAKGNAGDIGELAQIGKTFLPQVGGSSTVPNVVSTGMLTLAGGAPLGVVDPTAGLLSVGAMGLNRAIQSGINRNPAVVQSMLRTGTNLPALPQSVLRQPIGAGMLGGYLGSQ